MCVCVCMHACACLHPVQPPHSPPPAHTQYRVDSKASPTMLNCLLYKLSYYRFAESPAYGRPAGYDRVRNAEIGNKDVRLRHVEEAFTSENWIVRIYKVGGGTRALCLCVCACVCAHTHTHTHTPSSSGEEAGEPPPSALLPHRRGRRRPAVARRRQRGQGPAQGRVRRLLLLRGQLRGEQGACVCVRVPSCPPPLTPPPQIYGGGASGAQFSSALHTAVANRKRYFAVARAVSDGHSFSFDRPTGAPDVPRALADGCERPCVDDSSKQCGCVDDLCSGPRPGGQEHNRRWAVYRVVGK